MPSTVNCPYCHQETGKYELKDGERVLTEEQQSKLAEVLRKAAAAFDHIFISRKQCEKCGREFLIVNDVPMTEEQYRCRGLV